MALAHAHPLQPIDVSPLSGELSRAATHAILKTPAIELIRVVLQAGASMPVHRVPGEVTLQCLEGRVRVTGPEAACELQAHQLVLVPGEVLHGVEALEASSLLMTIVVPPGAPGSRSSTG